MGAKTLPCGRKSPVSASKHDAGETQRRMLDTLARHVADKGLRQSESRAQIVTVLCSLTSHFSASDLIAKVHARHPAIGAATIYRNLQTFVDAGILRETLALENGERVFEVETGVHHDHIVCLDCHAIFEFHNPTIEREQDAITQKLDFTPEGHRHVIYARCGNLRRRRAKS